jgi:hypothetical protein
MIPASGGVGGGEGVGANGGGDGGASCMKKVGFPTQGVSNTKVLTFTKADSKGSSSQFGRSLIDLTFIDLN